MLEKSIKAKLNTVFVEAPPIGNNYGHGTAESFLAFVDLVQEQQEDLIVFGWISNHKRTWPTPADLQLADERQAQADWVDMLLDDYPCLDGIAIDYIRYPTWEESQKSKLDGVTETVHIIRNVTDQRNKQLLSTSFNAATVTYRGTSPSWDGEVPAWFQDWYVADPNNYFQEEATLGGTGVVNQMNLNSTSNPDYLLGPSFMSYQQDPVTWMTKGYVDHVVPMQYTADPIVMQNDIDAWHSFLSFAGQDNIFQDPNNVLQGIHLGLGWLEEPSSFPDSKFDPAAMIKHIQYGRSRNVGGYTIFRLGIPGIDDDPLIQALTVPNADNDWNPPFSEKAVSPFSSSERGICQQPTTAPTGYVWPTRPTPVSSDSSRLETWSSLHLVLVLVTISRMVRW